MSELRVDNIVDMGGSGAPQLRKGASVTGISTITQAVVGNATINAGGINATGIVTSSSNKFVGDFASGNITAGVMTATSSVVASNITINSGGVNASGIVSATSYAGSGANLTGIGLSIAPLAYNPDVSDSEVSLDTGIGITFNQRVSAGTGNVTLSLVAVGSTLVENFGVGSSVTYNNDADPPNITINPTADLSVNTVYAISYPSGAFTQSGAGGSFVGTAYTFAVRDYINQLWAWGGNSNGQLANNNTTEYSSPIQVPGTWADVYRINDGANSMFGSKTTGDLWSWGYNGSGQLGQNNNVKYSSPVQIPGTTWSTSAAINRFGIVIPKTDGTLWGWGINATGMLGLNQAQPANDGYSSPVQIPGTTWSSVTATGQSILALKTNSTLWSWGSNESGQLGLNNTTTYSSPVQIPGTTWAKLALNSGEGQDSGSAAIKTDGTLWTWGSNSPGHLGHNNRTAYSSPKQVPGTTWSNVVTGRKATIATKTDGTLWVMGDNERGALGQNEGPGSSASGLRSSPTQIPGTNWDLTNIKMTTNSEGMMAMKQDGTIWVWGHIGSWAGLNSFTLYSSPVQLGSDTNWTKLGGGSSVNALKQA